jgi:hypothetical protein
MGVDGTETSKTRAQQRAAGTKKPALFDMVNRKVAVGVRTTAPNRISANALVSRPSARLGAPSRQTLVSRPSARLGGAFVRGVGTRARAGTQGPHDVI